MDVGIFKELYGPTVVTVTVFARFRLQGFSGYLSLQHGAYLGCGWRRRRVRRNILIKQSRKADKGCPPAWGLGEGLTTPCHKEPSCYETLHRASELVVSCEHGNEPSDSIKSGEFLD
jgi:hypothetical protein